MQPLKLSSLFFYLSRSLPLPHHQLTPHLLRVLSVSPGGGEGPTRGLPRLPLPADVPDRPPDGHPLPLGQGEGGLPSLAHERAEGRAHEHLREAPTAAGVAAAGAAPAAPAGPAAEEAPAPEARECERQSGDEGALGRVQRARDGDDRHQGRKVRERCYKRSLFRFDVMDLFDVCTLFIFLFYLVIHLF